MRSQVMIRVFPSISTGFSSAQTGRPVWAPGALNCSAEMNSACAPAPWAGWAWKNAGMKRVQPFSVR